MDTYGKIVLVDDEVMVTRTLETLLKLEGLKDTESFNDPLEALEYLKINQCELIISDFIMPKMEGIEFLSRAKKLPMQEDTTQILLTGYADKENAIKAINEVGIFKYIEKPWNNDDLVLNIKNAIERTNLKRALKEKIIQLKKANDELEEYSKNLEALVQKRSKELYESREKLNAIFTNCADGIVTIKKDCAINSLNQAACELFGTCEKELLNKNFFELIINEKNQRHENPFKSKKPVFLRDFSLVNYKNNTKIPIEISLAKIENDKDDFVVAVIRNVSYQKENERLRDDFIATLTHDLRTPLLAAISGLDFMLKGTLGEISEKQKELTLAMKKSNEDMLGLTNALLEVYRYEAGKIFLCKTRFCVNELIKDCAKELEVLFKQNNTEIIFDFENEELMINADKNEIRRVISNLLGNAIKHGGENTKVIVRSQKIGKDAQISVEDNGVGLSKEDQMKLFRRFSQGTSKRRSCSTGLGLYLSRRIVEAHNGSIWVESEVDKGSKFIFNLKNAALEDKVLL